MSHRNRRGLSLGLTLGVALDALLGDPRRHHPVAIFGSAAAALERQLYRPDRAAGARHLAASLAVALAPALVAQRAARRLQLEGVGLTALVAWSAIGGRSLAGAAADVAEAVTREDLAAARDVLPALCGRDPQQLDERGLVQATVESVAENTSDAVVAPLVWGALAGIPGLVLYRAINTLDAMVGHRSSRYQRFGTPAARLDDAVNWLPARLTALLAAALAPVVRGSSRDAVRAWRRDGPRHPSPNAGRAEAAFAGALGVRLGGPVVYPHGREDRPVLGSGRDVETADIDRAVRLSRAVTVAAVLLCAAGASTGAMR